MKIAKKGQAGGLARAKSISPEKAREQARKAASARWGDKPRKATHKGSFKEDFGIAVDCYVLDDNLKTAVISKGGITTVLGFGESASSSQFMRFLNGTKIAPHVDAELAHKLENPLIFQGVAAGPNIPPSSVVHGYDVTILIDICHAIVAAERDGKLLARQGNIAKQAHIILAASAKAGIQGLAYALAGYNPSTQEVIDAFKLYVQEEAKKYEREFPNELYAEWHRLYQIPVMNRGKPWHFKNLTVNHIYYPLAKSNGKILELMRALKSRGGDRNTKLFQFLNELGARALRIHMGRVLEMAESSADADTYERRIAARFGDQPELNLFPTSPTALLPPPSQSPPAVPAS